MPQICSCTELGTAQAAVAAGFARKPTVTSQCEAAAASAWRIQSTSRRPGDLAISARVGMQAQLTLVHCVDMCGSQSKETPYGLRLDLVPICTRQKWYTWFGLASETLQHGRLIFSDMSRMDTYIRCLPQDVANERITCSAQRVTKHPSRMIVLLCLCAIVSILELLAHECPIDHNHQRAGHASWTDDPNCQLCSLWTKSWSAEPSS